jgi:SAM-dependent methyltransferase
VTDAYDLVPYTDHAYAESHPDRLAVVAHLNRFEPPDVGRARVLELGSGRGGNLLPMAAGMPNATFVGVDRSRAQVAEAKAIARATGLGNVSLRVDDFEALDDDGEPFDYVIAHGLCSWIAPEARRALFRTIARSLSPRGIAYVSFNVLPGWYDRLAARDWLNTFATPDHARASLDELRSLVSPELAAYRSSLDGVAARIAETDVAYVTHEYFAAEHHPQLVSEFLDEAEREGLRYLGDAIAQQTALDLASPALVSRVEAAGPREAQQLLDFARATAFRRTLLVRADTCDAAGWRWSPHLDPDPLSKMSVTSRFQPTAVDGEVAFGDLTVQVGEHGRRALREIARVAPHAATIDASWREELFDLWLATQALDLHVHAPTITDGATERPRACPVARWHAAHGGAITNRWHHEVILEDDIARWVLARLDGTRTQGDLVRELVSQDSGAEPKALVRDVVAELASLALLVG